MSNSPTPPDASSNRLPSTAHSTLPTRDDMDPTPSTSSKDDDVTPRSESAAVSENEGHEQIHFVDFPRTSGLLAENVSMADAPIDYSLKKKSTPKEMADGDVVSSSDQPVDYSLKSSSSAVQNTAGNSRSPEMPPAESSSEVSSSQNEVFHFSGAQSEAAAATAAIGGVDPSGHFSGAHMEEGAIGGGDPQPHFSDVLMEERTIGGANPLARSSGVQLEEGAIGGVDPSAAPSPESQRELPKPNVPTTVMVRQYGKPPAWRKHRQEFFGSDVRAPEWPKTKTPKFKLEKTMKQLEDNYFTVVTAFSSYPAIFRAGDMVHGTVHIANRVGLPCTNITFFCQAVLEVDTASFSPEPGTKRHEGEQRSRRNKKVSKTFVKRVVYTDDVVGWLPEVGKEKALPPGMHTLHFAFLIPNNARPSTVEPYFILYYKIAMAFTYSDGRDYVRFFDLAAFTVHPLPALTSLPVKERHRNPYGVVQIVSMAPQDGKPGDAGRVVLQLSSYVLEIGAKAMVRILAPESMAKTGEDFMIYPKLVQHLVVDIEAETYRMRRTIRHVVPDRRPIPWLRTETATNHYEYKLALEDVIPSTINSAFPHHDFVRVHYTMEVEVRIDRAKRVINTTPVVIIQRPSYDQITVEDPNAVVTYGDSNQIHTNGAIFRRITLHTLYKLSDEDDKEKATATPAPNSPTVPTSATAVTASPTPTPAEGDNQTLTMIVKKKLDIVPFLEIKVPSSKPKFKFTRATFYSDSVTKEIVDRSDIIEIDSSIYHLLVERGVQQEVAIRDYFTDLPNSNQNYGSSSCDSDSDNEFLPTPIGDSYIVSLSQKPKSQRLKSKREKIRLGQHHQWQEEQRKSRAAAQKSSPERAAIPCLIISKVKSGLSEKDLENTNRWECFSRVPRLTISAAVTNESSGKISQTEKLTTETGASYKDFAGTGARPKVKTETFHNVGAKKSKTPRTAGAESLVKATGLTTSGGQSSSGNPDRSFESEGPQLTKNQRRKQRRAAKKLQERAMNQECKKEESLANTELDSPTNLLREQSINDTRTVLNLNPTESGCKTNEKDVQEETPKVKTEGKRNTFGITHKSPSTTRSPTEDNADEEISMSVPLEEEKSDTEAQPPVEPNVKKARTRNSAICDRTRDCDDVANRESGAFERVRNEQSRQIDVCTTESGSVYETLKIPASSTTNQYIAQESTDENVTKSKESKRSRLGQTGGFPTLGDDDELISDIIVESEPCPRTKMLNTTDHIGNEQTTSTCSQQETVGQSKINPFPKNVKRFGTENLKDDVKVPGNLGLFKENSRATGEAASSCPTSIINDQERQGKHSNANLLALNVGEAKATPAATELPYTTCSKSNVKNNPVDPQSKLETSTSLTEGEASDSTATSSKRPRRMRISDRLRSYQSKKSDSEENTVSGRFMKSSRDLADNQEPMDTKTDRGQESSDYENGKQSPNKSSDYENGKQSPKTEKRDDEWLTYYLTETNYPSTFVSNIFKSNNSEDINGLGFSAGKSDEIPSANPLIEKCLQRLLFEGETYYGKKSDTEKNTFTGPLVHIKNKLSKDNNILFDQSSLKTISENRMQKSTKSNNQTIDTCSTFYVKQSNISNDQCLKSRNEITSANTGNFQQTMSMYTAPSLPAQCSKDEQHDVQSAMPKMYVDIRKNCQTQNCGYVFIDQQSGNNDANQTHQDTNGATSRVINRGDKGHRVPKQENIFYQVIQQEGNEMHQNDLDCRATQSSEDEHSRVKNTDGTSSCDTPEDHECVRNESLPFNIEMPHRPGWNPLMWNNIFLQHSGIFSHKGNHIWAMDTDVIGDPKAIASKPLFHRKSAWFQSQKTLKSPMISSNSEKKISKNVSTLNNLRPIRSTLQTTDDEYKSLKCKVRWYSNMISTLKSNLKSSVWDYEKYDRLGLLQKEVDSLNFRIKQLRFHRNNGRDRHGVSNYKKHTDNLNRLNRPLPFA